jgi:hypothetical protein
MLLTVVFTLSIETPTSSQLVGLLTRPVIVSVMLPVVDAEVTETLLVVYSVTGGVALAIPVKTTVRTTRTEKDRAQRAFPIEPAPRNHPFRLEIYILIKDFILALRLVSSMRRPCRSAATTLPEIT